MIQILLGLIFLAFGIFLAFKIIGNLFKVILLVAVFIVGFYLIFGYVPYSNSINLKGFFGLSIDGLGRDKDGNILLFVKNKWFFEAKGLNVTVDGNDVKIVNNVSSISGRKSNVLQIDWKKDFTIVKINSSIGYTEFIKK